MRLVASVIMAGGERKSKYVHRLKSITVGFSFVILICTASRLKRIIGIVFVVLQFQHLCCSV